jgi:tetratricopeptide (TPR) repeat protein
MAVFDSIRHRHCGKLSGSAVACRAALLALAVSLTISARAQQAPQFEDLAAQAAAARDQQNVPAAIDLYSRAVRVKPDWPEGWWYLTLLQYSSNEYAGAIDAANHLLALEPHAVPAMALRGLSEFEIADYQDSLRDLQMAIEHGGANDSRNEQIIRYHLALALSRAGQFQHALDQYKLLAQEKVSDPEILAGVGLAGMRVTSFPSELRPEDRALYESAGSAGYAFLAGENNEAEALFGQLFAKYPATPNLHLFYGLLLFSHDPGLATVQLRSETTVAPDNVFARALLAFSLVLTGRYQEALPEAQRAYAADPTSVWSQLALGRSLGETGDGERGIELLKKVIEQDPNNMEAHVGLAALFARAGKREDAYRERMVCLKLAQ